jgi:hypothetical protein
VVANEPPYVLLDREADAGGAGVAGDAGKLGNT